VHTHSSSSSFPGSCVVSRMWGTLVSLNRSLSVDVAYYLLFPGLPVEWQGDLLGVCLWTHTQCFCREILNSIF
jgi:hypothetical protein